MAEVQAQAMALKHLHDAVRTFDETMDLHEDRQAVVGQRINIEALCAAKVAKPFAKRLAIGIDQLSAQISSSATPQWELTKRRHIGLHEGGGRVVRRGSNWQHLLWRARGPHGQDRTQNGKPRRKTDTVRWHDTFAVLSGDESFKLAHAKLFGWRAHSSCADNAQQPFLVAMTSTTVAWDAICLSL